MIGKYFFLKIIRFNIANWFINHSFLLIDTDYSIANGQVINANSLSKYQKINDEILFLAIEYIDCYIKMISGKKIVDTEDLYLIALTCLFLASKFLNNENNYSLGDLCNYTKNRFNR